MTWRGTVPGPVTAGGWGRGFVLAVSRRWPEPERHYRAWYHFRKLDLFLQSLARRTDKKFIVTTGDFRLGEVQLVEVLPDVHVLNMIAQEGLHAGSKGPPIRYEALGACLEKADEMATSFGASLHMPRIGTGLAGGRWEHVEPLLVKIRNEVYVYEY